MFRAVRLADSSGKVPPYKAHPNSKDLVTLGEYVRKGSYGSWYYRIAGNSAL